MSGILLIHPRRHRIRPKRKLGVLEYEQAKAHLEDCLQLAGDFRELYMSLGNSLRHITNQALMLGDDIHLAMQSIAHRGTVWAKTRRSSARRLG